MAACHVTPALLLATMLVGPAAAAPPPVAMSLQAEQEAEPQIASRSAEGRAEVEIDGPPAPVAPATIQRDDNGRSTMRAVRIAQPLKLDGRLKEEIYQTVAAVSGFIQQFPREGMPATEATAVWVFFDDANLYISAHCFESQPDRAIITELRRDHANIVQGDSFTAVLDTFYDRRNGFFFQTNALSAVRDQAISNGQQIQSWNTVWDVRSSRVPDGWTFEMVIPFKSLRYRRPGAQVWGINFRRIVKWKNETSYLTALPASYGVGGVSQMHAAGTLVDLEAPAAAKNLELKPFAVASSTTDQAAVNPFRNQFGHDVGIDLKYGLTSSLVTDITVNTDFAQVEEDLQQVNLTRFGLQFPEKRDFFLEGQGIFAFGATAGQGGQGGGGDVPIPFFSRRIGLSQGQAVPVIAGARVTGKAGAYDIGALSIQTGEKAAAGAVPTNFSAVRLKRDILRRSYIGLIATQRVETSRGTGASIVAGADANFRLSNVTTVLGYYAQTSAPGTAADGSSYRGRFDYAGDRYGLVLEHLMVDDSFNPAIGFLRRTDFRRSFVQARFSPRTQRSRRVRRLSWQGSFDYVTDAAWTTVENRTFGQIFDIEFHNSDTAGVDYTHGYEFLPAKFNIAPGVVVPAGSYSSEKVQGSYSLGQQRKLSGTAAAAWSTFYGGTRVESTYSGRITFTRQVAVEPAVTLNWVDLPFGEFRAQLVSSRVIVTPTPRLAFTGLVQVNASAKTVSSSARFRWEYIPGSELFVVYSDGRDTVTGGIGLLNRSIAVKVTRLLRF